MSDNKSWWVNKSRKEFYATAAEKQPAMSKSPEAKHVTGMVVAWGKRK